MSKIAIKGAETGTGVFTLESPATNTDRTILLPDEAGTVLTSASDVAASQITTALNATGSAPIYAARAWVNFNGTGTVAIRAAGNVSSITDNGTGDYTVNFTTAMADVDYACISTGGQAGSGSPTTNRSVGEDFDGVGRTTTAFHLMSRLSTGTLIDQKYLNVAIFR